VCLYGLTNAFS
jgi:hypothetical protein